MQKSLANISSLFQGNIIMLAILVVLILFPFLISAQNSNTSTIQKSDTSKITKHSPQKAALMSACLPGLGQIYNKKYWKLPIIYVGAGVITYFAILNSDNLRNYNKAYKLRMDGDPKTIDKYEGEYSDDNLLQIKNFYRRNLELTVIFAFGLYALNIIDASVDANLFEFDINDNLSMKASPLFFVARDFSVTGLSFSFKFGKTKK
jgi:hypothetical protein